jgi:hypothetical protein
VSAGRLARGSDSTARPLEERLFLEKTRAELPWTATLTDSWEERGSDPVSVNVLERAWRRLFLRMIGILEPRNARSVKGAPREPRYRALSVE